MPRMVVQPAYAKLNLNLLVGPPIPAGQPKAGYHPVSTIMQCIDLVDDVSVEVRPAGEPSRYLISWAEDALRPSAIDWTLDQDLAVRAHRMLEERVGKSLPIDLTVRKRIPVGGGLGGGSSDAAATLVTVDRAYQLGLSTADLEEIAIGLGSDVPFFVNVMRTGRTAALVEGLGEWIFDSPWRRVDAFVLVVPEFGCATRAVYSKLDDLQWYRLWGETDARVAGWNNLEEPAMMVEPRLGHLSKVVHETSGRACFMSGSGSTLYVQCVPDCATKYAEMIREGLLENGLKAVVHISRAVIDFEPQPQR